MVFKPNTNNIQWRNVIHYILIVPGPATVLGPDGRGNGVSHIQAYQQGPVGQAGLQSTRLLCSTLRML